MKKNYRALLACAHDGREVVAEINNLVAAPAMAQCIDKVFNILETRAMSKIRSCPEAELSKERHELQMIEGMRALFTYEKLQEEE